MNILFVEDEEIFYTLVEMLARKLAFGLFIAKNVADAFKTLETQKIDFAIIDYELPDACGDDINRYIKNKFPHIATAISSGHGETLKYKTKYDYYVDKSDLINFIKDIINRGNEPK